MSDFEFKAVFKKDVAYGRDAIVYAVRGCPCDRCGDPAKLSIDTSDGEYGSVDLCSECLTDLLKMAP